MSESEPHLVGGRYELGELLGRGGMAEVRAGIDTRLGRKVAVKRLRTDLASDPTFQARFRREAQSAASLNHPSIVAVYDTGEELSDDGTHVAQPYIVMEYVAGRTLRDVLREGRKILPERALEITSDVLSALDYSHRAGIIHRDIKPGNVMLTPHGDVKVMDFGIARAISDASSTMTQTAAVVGTAQYLSPEQARGETVDSRSDVYSAGCLLYELLTGRPPFLGDSPVAVAYQHVREPASPPSDHDDELDPALDLIVLKALAKRVEDRYQSAAAMRTDIERYLAGHPVNAPATAVQSPVPPAPAVAPPEPDPEPEEVYYEDERSNRGLWLIIALLFVAVIAAGLFLLPSLFEKPVEKVTVPDLNGKSLAEARSLISQAGLTEGVISSEPSETFPKDTVTDQDPNRDLQVDPGSPVNLTVSTGKPKVEVPYVVGQPRQAAKQALVDAGFKVKMVEEDSDAPLDQVTAVNPPPGAQVTEGSTLTLTYSDGPEAVPDVVGMKQKDAIAAIEAAGFKASVVETGETTEPKGTVVRVFPAAGTTVTKGYDVTIQVSTYVAPSPTPTPEPTATLPTFPPSPEVPPVDPGTVVPTEPAPTG